MWISVFLSSGKFSCKTNGVHYEPFNISRDIRQGDLISSYLLSAKNGCTTMLILFAESVCSQQEALSFPIKVLKKRRNHGILFARLSPGCHEGRLPLISNYFEYFKSFGKPSNLKIIFSKSIVFFPTHTSLRLSIENVAGLYLRRLLPY